jgi:hypothetical protein
MKWRTYVALFLALATVSCTLEVKPLARRSTHRATHRRAAPSAPAPRRKAAKDDSTLVGADWVKTYKAMEAQFKYSIPDDAKIKAEGAQFRVPRTVVNHFNDMAKATPPAQQ